MDTSEALALLIFLFTAAAVLAALLYATRERRAEKRHQARGERFRRRKNEERILGEGS